MKCEEFSNRMQESLDQRLDLESDWRLQRHARECEMCRGQLEAWYEIAAVVGPSVTVVPETTRRRRSRVFVAATGIAAAILLAVIWQVTALGPGGPERLSNAPSRVPGITDRVDPAMWWRDVQDRDWVAQTMPAVRSVRDGVAPLGRSLLQAVTILTTGGGHRTT